MDCDVAPNAVVNLDGGNASKWEWDDKYWNGKNIAVAVKEQRRGISSQKSTVEKDNFGGKDPGGMLEYQNQYTYRETGPGL